jgi:hypothetical protein
LFAPPGLPLRVIPQFPAITGPVAVGVALEAVAVEEVHTKVVQVWTGKSDVRTVLIREEDRFHKVFPRPFVVALSVGVNFWKKFNRILL